MSMNTEEKREENLRVETTETEDNAPRGLKALAPDDLQEELATIAGGVKRAAAKLTGRTAPVLEGEPVPVDVAAKKPFWKTFAMVAGLLGSAVGDAFKGNGKALTVKKEPRRPIFAEEPDAPEETTAASAAPSEKKLAKSVQRAKESINAGVARVMSEEHRETGRAVAKAIGGGFGEAFKGVAQGASAIRGAIVKKFPKAAPVFTAAGSAASKAGGLAGNALKATGRGLKAAGSVAGEKLRDIKDSGTFQNAGKKIGQSATNAFHSLAEGTKNAGSKLGQAARSAGENMKKGAQNAGTKFAKMKEKAGEKLAEHRAASAEKSTAPSPLAEKFKGVAAKTKERFETARNAASEKAHDLAQSAREKLDTLKSEHASSGDHENATAEKLKDIAGNFQAKAKGIVGKAREKMEHFITDDTDTK